MPSSRAPRGQLDRQKIVSRAIQLADESGLEPLTIRRLAERLDVKPMSLYHYVENKDDLLDGMVGAVFDEVEIPREIADWREAVRHRARSLRSALRRHPWAIPLMESRRTPGADILGHHNHMLSVWLSTGFPLAVVAHGVAIIDAFVYGFALQETALPLGASGGDLTDASDDIVMPLDPEQYPALTRFTVEHVMQPGYDFGDSFEVGLDVLIAGIERLGA